MYIAALNTLILIVESAALSKWYDFYMTQAQQLINDIVARHQLFGELCEEASIAYKAGIYTASLACLFVLIETSLKFELEVDPRDKWGLHKVIEEARTRNLITEDEYVTLSFLKTIRNKMFHEDAYSFVLEIGQESYFLSEPSTKQMIFQLHCEFVFGLVKRTVIK